MKKNKAIMATTMLFYLWLLFGLNTTAIAENIPISEDGIEQIGQNKIRLESGIGVIVFDLDKGTGTLSQDGFLTMSNTYNISILMKCNLKTAMSPVDLDENGFPRIHKKISDDIKFSEIPNPSWIQLENDEAVIKPYNIYNFGYTVTIPYEEVPSNNSIGYLARINIKKQLLDVSGAHIGIDYDYKLFIIFKGSKNTEFDMSQLIYVFIPVGIFGVVLFVYKTKHKIPRKKPEKIVKKSVSKPIAKKQKNIEKEYKKPDADIHKNIDDLLKKSSWREDG